MAEIESSGGLRATGTAFGATDDELTTVREELVTREPLRGFLAGARYRWLRFVRDGRDGDSPPQHFEASVYDYTNLRLLEVAGSLEDLGAVTVTPSARQPVPTQAEFDEAVGIIEQDHPLGGALQDGRLRAYQPMPPVAPVELADGRSRRVVMVRLYAPDPADAELLGGARHQLLGVDLTSQQLADAEDLDHLSDLDLERNEDCGAPAADRGCDPTGRTGQLELVVEGPGPEREELWHLVVVRPAESSGTNGSGVELRHVRYRGRSVLRRAHVPILNVEYHSPTTFCGPSYRDWLDEEACFQVQAGYDPLPGFRLTPRPPETIIEAKEDGGNFRGVAVHFEGNDLLLTSEMNAGWYRYVTEWRLRPDGTIEPRMGLSAVKNFCTCQLHVHHAYYRLDWTVDAASAGYVEEFNEAQLPAVEGQWQKLSFELQRSRNTDLRRHWRVSNQETGATYTITPGPDDGTADVYGAGDTWWLRFHEDEIDDGQNFGTTRARTRARIDLFVDGESIDGEDVVSWYAVHFEHDQHELRHENEVGEYLGPNLTCSWAAPPTGQSRLTTA